MEVIHFNQAQFTRIVFLRLVLIFLVQELFAPFEVMKIFSSVFLLKLYLISFHIQIVIHLELIFVYCIGQGSRYIFSLYGCPVDPESLIEKTVPPTLHYRAACVLNQVAVYMWNFFWTYFHSISQLLYFFCSTIMQASYYSFIGRF